MKTLKGKGFVLRAWKTDDAPDLVKHANNPKIAGFLRDGFPHPYTKDDADSWIEMIHGNKKDYVFAIVVEGEAAGGIGLHPLSDVYRFNVELGYWLSEKHWGKGIISEAVRLVVDHAFSEHEWVRIFAGVFSNNPASMRVLEKNGFRKEAVHRKAVRKGDRFLDEVIYSLLREDWD